VGFHSRTLNDFIYLIEEKSKKNADVKEFSDEMPTKNADVKEFSDEMPTSSSMTDEVQHVLVFTFTLWFSLFC